LTKKVSIMNVLTKLPEKKQSDVIAIIDPDDMRQYSVVDRFQAIAKINHAILEADPAPKDNPNKHVSEERFRNEIMALVNISQSMEHTDDYKNWLRQCRLLLMKKLYDYDPFVLHTRLWNVHPEDRLKALKMRENFHTEAANETGNIIYVSHDIKYRNWKSYHVDNGDNQPQQIKNVLYGSFTGLMNPKGYSPHSITLNTHPDAFNFASKAQNTHHHEKTHGLGFQLGFVFATHGKRAVEPFSYDAELCFHLYNERALISPRINQAYLSQFHEKVAFHEGGAAENHFNNVFPQALPLDDPDITPI